MSKFKLIGAALVLSAMAVAPVSAQVGEPALAAAQDPNFSIYSSYPTSGAGFSAVRAQATPDDTAGLRMSVRPHRTHHR